jgi:ribosome-associated translation inhibitor RaiA
MQVTITARHCDVPETLRERARTLVERLARLAPRPHHGRVLFIGDHGPTVEIQLHVPHGEIHVGRATGADHASALDRAVAKVRRQLDKSPRRRRRGTGRRTTRERA